MAWEAPWEAGPVKVRLYLFKTSSSSAIRRETEGATLLVNLTDGANADDSMANAIAVAAAKKRILGNKFYGAATEYRALLFRQILIWLWEKMMSGICYGKEPRSIK
mmetsp:Transcript_4851/g.10704  ORF Transcript_4851/g.10704 Transcript_4851/m.10704 type:complete len:106 (-) Transcript_4851:8-325(-)